MRSCAPSLPMGERVVPQSRDRVRGWFMVPMRAQKRKEATHEPRGARLRRALISNGYKIVILLLISTTKAEQDYD